MKLVYYLLIITILLLIASGFTVDLSSSKLISRVSFEKIQLGMTESEVTQLLGPPGNYFTGRPGRLYVENRGWHGPFIQKANMTSINYRREWNGDYGGLSVGFDSKGNTVSVVFCYST